MTVTTLSGGELNQDLGRTKRATKDGPVIITDRGLARTRSPVVRRVQAAYWQNADAR